MASTAEWLAQDKACLAQKQRGNSLRQAPAGPRIMLLILCKPCFDLLQGGSRQLRLNRPYAGPVRSMQVELYLLLPDIAVIAIRFYNGLDCGPVA